jgi:hypothetical protein
MSKDNIVTSNVDNKFEYEYYCPICKEWKIFKVDYPISNFSSVQICSECFEEHNEVLND